jgi:glutathione S-transferase
MSGAYRLFGAETSAFSTKMRSYLRYKGADFDWRPRTQASEEELRSLWRFPTLPVLVTASGFAVHDTTDMVDALEADTPQPSATPSDPELVFLACVLEEYADAWLAKAVYHYRWTRKKDQRLAAQRVIDDYYGDNPPADRKAAEDSAIVAMLGQLKSLGLEGELGGVVEKSFKRFVKLLDDHLRRHLFIFGGAPTIADFAIAGQLIQLMKDPTPAKIIEKDGEFVAKWCEFMADPKAGGPFATLDELKETLAPIFASEVAQAFLPWAAENLESSLAHLESFSVTLGKDELQLAPLRSSARSFRELRKKFVSAQTIEALKAFTDDTGSTVYLLRPPMPERASRRDRPREETGVGEESADEGGAPAEAGETMEAADAAETAPRRKRRRRRRGGSRRDAANGTTGDMDAADDAGEDFDAEDDEAETDAVSADAADVEAPASDSDALEADAADAAPEAAAGAVADDDVDAEPETDLVKDAP